MTKETCLILYLVGLMHALLNMNVHKNKNMGRGKGFSLAHYSLYGPFIGTGVFMKVECISSITMEEHGGHQPVFWAGGLAEPPIRFRALHSHPWASCMELTSICIKHKQGCPCPPRVTIDTLCAGSNKLCIRLESNKSPYNRNTHISIYQVLAYSAELFASTYSTM